MAVLGRLLLGSAGRLDLPDLLSIDSYTAADFKYLIQTFIGGNQPYVLKGFDVIEPADSIGTENVSIRIANSVVYYGGSSAGSFYYGLPEGNINALPIVPELRKNATNFVYLTFTTFDTAKDSRAFWDPDQNGGEGGEFSQDVNTESVLSIQANVSISTFPENTIPICKVKVGSSVIESIEDCRDMMFRLGSGGVTPDPFSTYTFRDDPTSTYARTEPPTLMSSAGAPNPFQGGDKNIFTLKEWMDVVMTKLKELGGTTYWYEGSGSGPSPSPGTKNIFLDALASTLKSKGEWQHSGTVAGQATWTEDIHYLSLRDPRDIILRASTVTLANNEVAWIDMIRDTEINNSSTPVSWNNGFNYVDGVTGAFTNLKQGDWVKKKADTETYYLRVDEFYASTGLGGGTTSAVLAQSIRLSDNYAGTTNSEIGEYTKGTYSGLDFNITSRDDAAALAAGGNFFWLAHRSDTNLALGGITPTQLTIDITEADGQRAKVTSTVANDLIDGDRVTIAAGAYAGTYPVEVADTTNFFIETTVTGDSLTQTAYYAVVTTAARNTAYSYNLESANHGYESNQNVKIQGTSTAYDGSYLISVRSATSFQIPMASFIANPGAISGEIVCLPRMNVRTEFGTVKVVQGESVDIGEADSQNILSYVGMESLAQLKPTYYISSSNNNMLYGYQNFNSSADDDLTVRAARLTAMMADRVQDRSTRIIGRTNITSVTSGANQQISALANLTLVKPSSPDQTITLTSPINLPVDSAIVVDLDRNGSASLTPTVVSLGSQLLLQENRLLLFYRFSTTSVYDWNGNVIQPSGHINTAAPEDSQNRNVFVFNPGTVQLNISTNALHIKVDESVEISSITAIDAASVPQSSYFKFNGPYNTNKYYVWYNKDGGGTDPLVVGRTAIPVAITTGQNSTTVASLTVTALNLIAGADITATNLVDVITLTNDTVGESDDIANGTPSTTFTLSVTQQGFDPDISIIIPGSANNTVNVDVVNTLGTLTIADGQSIWVRINRFAAKTFTTVSFTDTPDTDIAGALYVTDTTAVPIDQDVIVLWSRIGNNIAVTHESVDPKGNIYEEFLDVISVAPSNSYEVQGPVTANTILQLPLDSRDGGSIQEYVVGSAQLKLYLNGQFLRHGIDWISVGNSGALSKRVQVLQDLVIGDVLAFRLDSRGSVYFAASAGGGGSLQDSYDAGRFITTIVGQPMVISGPSGKLLSILGDLEVTGVIDPSGITFSQSVSDPLNSTDFGLWRNSSDDLVYKRGVGAAFNLSTDLIRRDGTATMLAALNMNSNKITNLATPTADTDASTKLYVDDLSDAVSSAFLKLDGTNPMAAALNMNSNKITNLATPTLTTDASTKQYVDDLSSAVNSAFLKLDGTNPMAAALNMNTLYKIINLADPTVAQDAATKAYVDLFLKRDGTNSMTADLNLNSNKLINVTDPTAAQDGATKAYVDLFLKRDGTNSMTASLNLNSNKLINVTDPTAAQDAATKAYVDSLDRYSALYLTLTNNTGSTILAGSIVALSLTTAGEVILANASALSTSNTVAGIAVANITTGSSGKVQIAGEATVLTTSSLVLGKRVYISSTSGRATSTPTTTIGQTVFVLGFANSTSTVILAPHLDTINDNVYEEKLLVISGSPANSNEIASPVNTGATLTLPLDSRATSSVQQYVVGGGFLEVYLNGQILERGDDYLELGANGTASSTIQIQQDLVITDEVTFRINLSGSAYFSVGGGGTGTLQDTYNNGNSITVSTGVPFTINGPVSEKLFVVNGDIEVTGLVDPKGITFIPQSSNPIPLDKAGFWANSSGEILYQKGDNSSPTNVTQELVAGAPASAVKVALSNNSGSTLAKLTPVSVNSSGELAVINVSSEASASAAIGLVDSDISNATSGNIVLSGSLLNISTSAALGDILYVSKTGGVTNVKPSIGVGDFVGGDFVIKLGVIYKNVTTPANKDLVVNIEIVGQL